MKMRKSNVVFLLVLVLGTMAAWADKKAQSTSSADLQFTVVKDTNGKPVRNASVILHPVNEKGEQDKGGIQSKTSSEGRVTFPGMPYGRIRVQVIAHGLQTFGEDFEVNQPTHEFTIKLKPPQGQYSIYEDHPGEKKVEPAPEKK